MTYYFDVTQQQAIDLNDLVFTKLMRPNGVFVAPAVEGTTSFINTEELPIIIDSYISYYIATGLSSPDLTQTEKDFMSDCWNTRKTEEEMRALGKLPPNPYG